MLGNEDSRQTTAAVDSSNSHHSIERHQTVQVHVREVRIDSVETTEVQNERLPTGNRRKMRQPRRMHNNIKLDVHMHNCERGCIRDDEREAFVKIRGNCDTDVKKVNRRVAVPKLNKQSAGDSLVVKSKCRTVTHASSVLLRRGRSRLSSSRSEDTVQVPLKRAARRRRVMNTEAALIAENEDSDEKPLTVEKESNDVTKSGERNAYPCYICDREVLKRDMEEHLVTHKSGCSTASDSRRESDRIDGESNAEEDEASCEGPPERRGRHPGEGDCEIVDQNGMKRRSGGEGRNSDAKLPCEFCGALFSKRYMPYHKRVHTGNKPFTCDICLKQFPTNSGLKAHVKMCHGERKGTFRCDVCQQMYSSEQSLRCHKNIHSEEKPYQCTVCGKAFKQLSALCNHTKTHSSGLSHQCDVCGNRYKGPDILARHRQYHHEGVRPSYSCEECGKSFTRRPKLKDHLMWHRGTSPYVCSYCGRRLMTRETLRTHELIHEDRKPYKCSVCQKGFRQSHVLKRHMSIHTGVKPFSCALCGKQFIHRVYLARHKCQMTEVGDVDLPSPVLP